MSPLAGEFPTVGAGDLRWEVEAGLTYRQLDFWTRKGWLLAMPGDLAPGSGYARRWPASEIDVARRIVALQAAGFTIVAAAEIARLGPRTLRVVEPEVSVEVIWR